MLTRVFSESSMAISQVLQTRHHGWHCLYCGQMDSGGRMKPLVCADGHSWSGGLYLRVSSQKADVSHRRSLDLKATGRGQGGHLFKQQTLQSAFHVSGTG